MIEKKIEELSQQVTRMQEDMITRKHHEVIVEGLSQTLIELNEIKKTLEVMKSQGLAR